MTDAHMAIYGQVGDKLRVRCECGNWEADIPAGRDDALLRLNDFFREHIEDAYNRPTEKEVTESLKTDWYDRGCTKRCRDEHTREWGQCDLADPPPPKLNLHVFETAVMYDGVVSGKFREVTVEEAYLEIARYRADLATRKCQAVCARFGPHDVYCTERARHSGNHRDAEGHEWMNLSELWRWDEDD